MPILQKVKRDKEDASFFSSPRLPFQPNESLEHIFKLEGSDIHWNNVRSDCTLAGTKNIVGVVRVVRDF